MICGGVRKCNNQLLDKEGLFMKATEELTVQHRPGEETAAGREMLIEGKVQTTTPRHETPTRREQGFFLYNHAPGKRKEAGTMPSMTKGAASPWFDGEGSKTC